MIGIWELVTRDKSSGRYHTRFVEMQEGFDIADPLSHAKRILTDERCNLDQAGGYEVVTDIPEGVDPKLLCQNCFPPNAEAHG